MVHTISAPFFSHGPAANKLQRKSSRKPRLPRNWNPVDGGAPKLACYGVLRGPKLGALQRSSVKRRHLLGHTTRLLMCAQGQFALGAGLHNHSSELLSH